MKDKYKNLKILVIGDSCTDVFMYGHVPRLAPEGPAPVFNPVYSKQNGGMALNVKANIEAIGAQVTLITQLEKITKTRYVDERTNSLLLRVDEDIKLTKINQSIVSKIKNNSYNDIKYDAVVLCDYCKGFLTEDDIEILSKQNNNVFMDTKKILGEWCKFVDYIKINHVEYERTKHTINNLNIYNKLIITHSDKGCEYQNNIFPVKRVNCKDLSGAGDTFISGLVCEFVRTLNVSDAIGFAQECATKVVQKLGVCTI
jgi:D-beta-D-heptose 7-phosphate kinase/D-beta-D-heptose 1-phosphate adenosyltransferase